MKPRRYYRITAQGCMRNICIHMGITQEAVEFIAQQHNTSFTQAEKKLVTLIKREIDSALQNQTLAVDPEFKDACLMYYDQVNDYERELKEPLPKIKGVPYVIH